MYAGDFSVSPCLCHRTLFESEELAVYPRLRADAFQHSAISSRLLRFIFSFILECRIDEIFSTSLKAYSSVPIAQLLLQTP
jgi:hypothetical protein